MSGHGARAGRGRLIVSNPDEGSSDDDTHHTPYAHQQTYGASYPYYSPSVPPHASPPRPTPPTYPLITPFNDHQPNERTPKPQLSSPSSTSSLAAEESTPPPSTPGGPGHPVDLRPDFTSQDNGHATHSNDSPDVAPIGPRRTNGSIPYTVRDFASRSQHKPPAPSPPSPPKQAIIMATSDSDRYSTIDITGARDAAFIRECIFTKVSIVIPLYLTLLKASFS